MANPAVDRFFDLLRGGKSPAEAKEESGLTREQAMDIADLCVAVLESESFAPSNYDLFIAERLRSIETGLAERDERLSHDISSMAKCTLELVKTVNRLVDAQRAPEVREEAITKVVPFPCTNPPKAS